MTWCFCSHFVNLIYVASPLAAAEAGLLPSAWLGPFLDEAPWGTLQEHDRPSGNQLPGPQIAPQGLSARLLPVAATLTAHTLPATPRRASEGGGWPPFLLISSLFLLSLLHLVCSCLPPCIMDMETGFSLSSPSFLPWDLYSTRKKCVTKWHSSDCTGNIKLVCVCVGVRAPSYLCVEIMNNFVVVETRNQKENWVTKKQWFSKLNGDLCFVLPVY